MIESRFLNRGVQHSGTPFKEPLIKVVDKNHRENLDDYPEFNYG